MGVGFLGRAAWPLGIALFVGAMTLAGCSSTGGLGLLRPYSVSSDDTCGDYKTELRSYRDFFFTSILAGAAAGAAVGGITGYLAGGTTRDTLLGAGLGGVVGGVGGYYLAKQKASNGNKSELTDAVYDDVKKENSQIDGATQAFRKLRDCRTRTARLVKRDFTQRRLSHDDAQTKLKQIHDWLEEDIDFADALGAKMDTRGAEYADASDKMTKSDPSAKRRLSRRKAPPSSEGSGDSGGGLVAGEAVRVRAEASTSSAQVGSLSPGEAVTPIADDKPTADWTHVQLGDGHSGYVASRLLRPAGAGASGAPPPEDVAGVAELTDSNQLKRRALKDDIVQAKNTANGSTFELSGSISRLRPAPVPRIAA